MEDEPFEHSGNVHDPSEFGFDLVKPEDQAAWGRITGEVKVIGDFTAQEALQVQALIALGHSRDTALQTVLCERIG